MSDITVPFNLQDFSDNQEKIATKQAITLMEGISSKLYEKSLCFIYRDRPVEVNHDSFKDVDPYVASKVIEAFLQVGWAHVEYHADGWFILHVSKETIKSSHSSPTFPSTGELIKHILSDIDFALQMGDLTSCVDRLKMIQAAARTYKEPDANEPVPVEYEDSFEFTQEYELVQRIVTSTRWMEWLRETGAGDDVNMLIDTMNEIDIKIREFDGG